MTADDQTLVSVFLRDRDEEAFRALYRAHTPVLFRIARRMLRGDRQAAEDLLQIAWTRAAGRLHEFRWESSLRTWLTGILLNCAKEQLRARRAEPPANAIDTADRAIAADSGGPGRIDLERAVAILPDGYREVLILHDIEGYSHQEIASLLGMTRGASKSQLSHARDAVRRRLGAQRGPSADRETPADGRQYRR